MNLQVIAIFFLSLAALGGVLYVFLDPFLTGEKQAERRQQAIQGPAAAKRSSFRGPEVSKRDQVLQSLKELDSKQRKAKSPSLSVQIEQAGLDWTKRQFFLGSIGSAIATSAVIFMLSGSLPAAGGGLLVGGFGIPRWYLKRRKAKRLAAFAREFPNALDVIVRGVKAGLPLGDCFRIIAGEAGEPVKSEFRVVMETQSLGIPLGDAVQRIYERMPCSEANFFGIVISIQQKAGGNLSEALGNLSKVLRERKKMREKIKAVSTEAKASAGIIGALPPVVAGMVYLTTPDYIARLWETSAGNVMLAICAFWMGLGIFVMKKMINFDF